MPRRMKSCQKQLCFCGDSGDDDADYGNTKKLKVDRSAAKKVTNKMVDG